jgi:beta-glucosidase
VEAAKKSDVAVVCVGDSPALNAEIHDRADLNLTGYQDELVKAVYETGTPTVVVLVNARPLTVNYIAKHIPAIVEAWNPGEEGGNAVADVLFGDYNPGGKLPITFPRAMGQLPVYYNHEPGWHTNSYVDGTDASPLYPFGYGLSYTTFTCSAPKLSSPKMRASDTTQVSVDVRNTGDRRGDEVVQMYIHDTEASVVRPVKELKGFKRITLNPGEQQTVTFNITGDLLAFYNKEMKRIVEPGTYEIMIGGSSTDLKTVNIEVTTKGRG